MNIKKLFLVFVAALALILPFFDASANEDFFNLYDVKTIHIKIPKNSFLGMERVKTDEKKSELKYHDKGNVSYPIKKSHIEINGKNVEAEIRYKGNLTYAAAGNTLRKSFRIKFTDKIEGIPSSIVLNNGIMDPTRKIEALSYLIFRNSGIPAPKTSFANVFLTVPGIYEKEDLGLYTIVEPVNKSFLKKHFAKADELLLKPKESNGILYLGEDWNQYIETYKPENPATKEQESRFISFAKLINNSSDEIFYKEIENYIDVENLLKLTAINAIGITLDSFFYSGKNIYIYLNPENNKFIFIPWDLDLSMGLYRPVRLKIDENFDVFGFKQENLLLKRILENEKYKSLYIKYIEQIINKIFNEKELFPIIEKIENFSQPILESEKIAMAKRNESLPDLSNIVGDNIKNYDLRNFIKLRYKSIKTQIEKYN